MTTATAPPSTPTGPPLGPTHPPASPGPAPAAAQPAPVVSAARRRGSPNLGFWYGPLVLLGVVVAVFGVIFVRSIGADGPKPEELARAAFAGAAQGSPTTQAVTTTTAAFDYLTPFLTHPISDDAASIITFQNGTWNLSTEISLGVANQVRDWYVRGFSDCQLSISVVFANDGARVVYPPLPDGRRDPDHVPLVKPETCPAGLGGSVSAPTGPLPDVTTTTGALR